MDFFKLKRLFNKEAEKDNVINEAERLIVNTGDIARKCLTHEDFRLYRDAYIRTERASVNALILYTKNFVENPGGDINKYAITCMRLLTRIQDLRALLNNVDNDAKREEK